MNRRPLVHHRLAAKDSIQAQIVCVVFVVLYRLGERNESAPKLGVWTGWQIVRLYMEKHPDVTLKDLMLDNDYQKILTDANYRPKNPDK